jgi:hypothetical protein
MFWRWRPPIGFGLSALTPPALYAMWARFTVLSETPIAFCKPGLRHTALAEQHQLDALALHRRELPPQRSFHSRTCFLPHLTIRSPGSDSQNRITSILHAKNSHYLRFNQLWKRYNAPS